MRYAESVQKTEQGSCLVLWRPRVTMGNKRTERVHLTWGASNIGHGLLEAFSSLLGTDELGLQIIVVTSVSVILPLPTLLPVHGLKSHLFSTVGEISIIWNSYLRYQATEEVSGGFKRDEKSSSGCLSRPTLGIWSNITPQRWWMRSTFRFYQWTEEPDWIPESAKGLVWTNRLPVSPYSLHTETETWVWQR